MSSFFDTKDEDEKQRGSCGQQILTADMAGLCGEPCGGAVHGSGRPGPAGEPRGGRGSRQAAGPAAVAEGSLRLCRAGRSSINDAAGNPPHFAPGITPHTRQQDGTQTCDAAFQHDPCWGPSPPPPSLFLRVFIITSSGHAFPHSLADRSWCAVYPDLSNRRALHTWGINRISRT
jgi:hypothetical protein